MQVTFVCSNNFAGSTFLDVMLGHGERCFACGEVYNLFREKRGLPCICGDSNCQLWNNAKKQGREQLYQYIHSLGYDWISDSSKRLMWFITQNGILRKQGIDPKKILIYKHPLNWLYSIYKRRFNRPREPEIERWISYNSRFLKFFGDEYIVSYEDLAQNPTRILRKICKKLGYRYFKGKERFWKGISHHLYGALSIRLQFTEKGSLRFRYIYRKLMKKRTGTLHSRVNYRTIYYVDEWEEKLPKKYHKIPKSAWNLYNRLEKRKIR